MYFIPKAGSDLHRNLMALLAEANEAQQAAFRWTKSQGFTQHYAPYRTIGGGVLAVIAPENPDKKHWKAAGWLGAGAWQVRDKSPLKKELDLLPRVSTQQLNDLIQYEEFSRPNPARFGSFVTTYSPGFKVVGGTVVFHYPEEYDLALHPDLEEITHTAFKQMCKAANSLADLCTDMEPA